MMPRSAIALALAGNDRLREKAMTIARENALLYNVKHYQEYSNKCTVKAMLSISVP